VQTIFTIRKGAQRPHCLHRLSQLTLGIRLTPTDVVAHADRKFAYNRSIPSLLTLLWPP